MRSRNGARQPLQPQPQPLLGGGGGGPQGRPPPKSQLALRGLGPPMPGPPMPGPPNPPGPPGPGPNPCIAAPFNCGHCPQLTHLVAAPLQLLAEIYVSRLAKNCRLFALGCFALATVAKKQRLRALWCFASALVAKNRRLRALLASFEGKKGLSNGFRSVFLPYRTPLFALTKAFQSSPAHAIV